MKSLLHHPKRLPLDLLARILSINVYREDNYLQKVEILL